MQHCIAVVARTQCPHPHARRAETSTVIERTCIAWSTGHDPTNGGCPVKPTVSARTGLDKLLHYQVQPCKAHVLAVVRAAATY